MRIGINGFGRMGRLFLRAAWEREELDVVAVDEPHGEASTMTLFVEHDSVQRRFDEPCSADGDELVVGDQRMRFTRAANPSEIDWAAAGVELVIESSGRFKTKATLEPHLANGAERVLVSCAVKDVEPNVVLGVNHDAYDLANEPIVTAASCTTNCLAPVVRVIHDALGIERGIATTIHDPTNTQVVIDAPHRDPRRARASQLNLIPTSSNSAYAVTMIVPELAGKLESIAVRVPVMNSSITDCVFHVARDTTIDEVNGILETASRSDRLRGVLGYEERPLVSSDYAGDPRSSIVDALSTRVTDRRMVKILAWYDNEWGYANRMADLALLMGGASRHA
jgi:glyceraldehyde 3-phosphate dehydrogenase